LKLEDGTESRPDESSDLNETPDGGTSEGELVAKRHVNFFEEEERKANIEIGVPLPSLVLAQL